MGSTKNCKETNRDVTTLANINKYNTLSPDPVRGSQIRQDVGLDEVDKVSETVR